MVIKHRPGPQHRNADPLSRVSCKHCGFVVNWEAVGSTEMVKFLGGKDDEETDKDLQTVIDWLTTSSRPSYSRNSKQQLCC